MHDSNRTTSCIFQPESPIVGATINRCGAGIPKTISQGGVQWHTVSSVTCHVTWRVMEVPWAIGFFNK